MSKYCVILASHIPSVDRLWVGREILDRVVETLVDVDVIVGVNPSECTSEWVNLIKEYTPHHSITNDELVVNSDASAYQTALNLYKKNNKQYEFVWFLHTQGTKSGRHDVRNYHLNNLLVTDVLNALYKPLRLY